MTTRTYPNLLLAAMLVGSLNGQITVGLTHSVTFGVELRGSPPFAGPLDAAPDTANFSCEATKFVLSSNVPGGSLSVDVLRRAGSPPTAADRFNSAPLALNNAQSSVVPAAGRISPGDVFSLQILSASGPMRATVRLYCQETK